MPTVIHPTGLANGAMKVAATIGETISAGTPAKPAAPAVPAQPAPLNVAAPAMGVALPTTP